MTINVGPQHPSTHGVFRLRVTFDGEEILEVEPIFGYLHRGTEKLAEERTYVQIVTLTDRLDYVSSMINNQAYCLAVEKLLGVEPPLRAKWLRTMVAELQRIASHLMGIGFFLQDLGTLGTPLMYGFRIREKILDLFEMACGARLTTNYMRIGGVSRDVPPEFRPALRKLLDELPMRMGEYEDLLAAGVIDPAKVGLGHIAFVEIKLSNTTEAALNAFNAAVRKLTEVEQCHMIAGGFDYLLKVRTGDITAYRRVLGEKISALPHVAQSSTYVAMEAVKDEAGELG